MTPPVLQHNYDVDYVISYRISSPNKEDALLQFRQLIRSLAHAGLETEVRNGDETSLLVFVRAADEKIFAEVIYRSRIRDWLYGVRQIQPVRNAADTLTQEPLTDSERHRQVYNMITTPLKEGGAGITPKHGDWKNVEAIFPLHDHVKNKKWLTEFSKKTLLTPEDIDQIRDTVGEKIGYYYAFLQSYFSFMMFPAAFGFACWVLLGGFSPIYAIVNGLWTVVFVEWWKRQEQELAIRWGVKNVSLIESRRREFRPEKQFTDKVTGEEVALFPAKKRLQRQLLQIPLALVSVVALGVLICTCYAIEIFISEVYSGPFKDYLVFTPTIILVLFVPIVSTYLTGFAEQLNDFENYETKAAYDKALTAKIFVINFITSYTAIFLTSFVYVPFAAIIVPYLDFLGMTVKPFAEHDGQVKTPPAGQFSINPNRLKNQMIYFAVTAQIVNFALETIVPFLTKEGKTKVKQLQSSRAKNNGGRRASLSSNDPEGEKDFLSRVREEAALPEYDVTTDLREMCIQFGYLALFSVIWPLTPVSYFINNWIELRGDTFKLTVESRRPNPERADSIGPWLDSLEFLAWLGSLTSAALVYMFRDDGVAPDGRPTHIKLWALLLSVFLSEHIFLVVRTSVRHVISKLDSENMRKERSERYMVRMRFLQDSGLGDVIKPLEASPNSPLMSQDGSPGQVFTREVLENDAREASLKDTTPTTSFWKRQRGWTETEQVGLRLIEMMDVKGKDEKKVQ